MMPGNPYRAEAGPDLDALIHVRLMMQATLTGDYPAYSTEAKLAEKVLAVLRTAGRQSVIVGRTELKDRTWFARYETNAMDGTEVFADTFALAICRLALLRIADREARQRT